jgi:hypothetical protein
VALRRQKTLNPLRHWHLPIVTHRRLIVTRRFE